MITNQELIDEIKGLRREITELKQTTSRMDGHIDFVESIYEIVKAPFFALLNMVKLLPNQESRELEH